MTSVAITVAVTLVTFALIALLHWALFRLLTRHLRDDLAPWRHETPRHEFFDEHQHSPGAS